MCHAPTSQGWCHAHVVCSQVFNQEWRYNVSKRYCGSHKATCFTEQAGFWESSVRYLANTGPGSCDAAIEAADVTGGVNAEKSWMFANCPKEWASYEAEFTRHQAWAYGGISTHITVDKRSALVSSNMSLTRHPTVRVLAGAIQP